MTILKQLHRIHYRFPGISRLNRWQFSSVSVLDNGEDFQEPHSIYKFKNHFKFKSVNNQPSILLAPEGCYVDVDDSNFSELLPEGLAGDANQEFDFASRKLLMMRDPIKLLCKILDTVDVNRASIAEKGMNDDSISTKSFRVPITIPGFTDRPEWSSARMNVQYYGSNFDSKYHLEKYPSLQKINDHANQEQTDNIENYIQKLNAVGMPRQYLLQGPRGSGKSMCLNQLVLHARQNGWLCLFIPDAWEHVHGGLFIEPCEISPEKGLFNNVFMTTSLLRKFYQAHQTILHELPIQNQAETKKYEKHIKSYQEAYKRITSVTARQSMNFIQIRAIIEEEDTFPAEDELDEDFLESFKFDSFQMKSLGDMILLAIAFRDLSGAIFMDLIEELKEIQNVPVLIAIDQYNTWLTKSGYQYENKEVMSSNICVPHALQILTKSKASNESWKLKNGITVCSTSYKHPEGLKDNFLAHTRSVPVTITVPVYSQVEFLAAIKYYMDCRLIDDMFTTQELIAYRMHCASNPAIVRQQCVSYFFPLAMSKYTGDFLYYPDARDEVGDLNNLKVNLDEIDDL